MMIPDAIDGFKGPTVDAWREYGSHHGTGSADIKEARSAEITAGNGRLLRNLGAAGSSRFKPPHTPPVGLTTTSVAESAVLVLHP